MKSSLVAGALTTCLLASSTYAQDYMFEWGAELDRASLDSNAVEMDIDTKRIGLRAHLGKVDTSKGPLQEASFLDKSSFIQVSNAEIDPDNADNVDDTAIGVRGVLHNIIVLAAFNDGDLDDSKLFGLGTYFGDNTAFLVNYITLDDSETDTISLNVHRVLKHDSGTSTTLDIGIAHIDTDEDKGFGVRFGASYYPNNNLGLGLGFDTSSVGDLYRQGFELDLSYFVLSNIALSLSYQLQKTEIDFIGAPSTSIDADRYSFGVNVRF